MQVAANRRVEHCSVGSRADADLFDAGVRRSIAWRTSFTEIARITPPWT
jgi:hypothetical protein